MVFSWKDLLLIPGLTAILIFGGTVESRAARPPNEGDYYTSVTADLFAPQEIGYEALLRAQLAGILDAPGVPATASAGPDSLPPPIPQKLLVFFEAAKTDLCPDAKLIVHEAAAEAQRKPDSVTVIQVTDLSGHANGMSRLSQERAKIVKNELVNLGVPQDQIVVSRRAASESRAKIEIVYE